MRFVSVVGGVLLLLAGCGVTIQHPGGVATEFESSPNVTPTPTPDPVPTPTPTLVPASGLLPSQVGLIVNLDDPQSVQVGAYYQTVRGIPDENVISIHMTSGSTSITSAEFSVIKSQVDAQTPGQVQAFALAWTLPYRVGCMSVTSAFALGFDTKYCNTTGGACGITAPVPYYNSNSIAPFDDFGIRPAMSLAGLNFNNVKALIDRGVRSDFTFPAGTAYLVRSTDTARSVRYTDFFQLDNLWQDTAELTVTYLDQSATGPGYITGQTDVMFYLASLVSVANITTNTYLPGAVADHLTSYGGRLTDSSQMSILRWLEAGATGSYGTVVEPCAYTSKFPRASVLIPKYFEGASLVEAYWKSVSTPGEGIFVGDPLARPFVPLVAP